MGTNAYFFVGAYLKVFMPTITITVTERRCSNCEKIGYNFSFCPDCGGKVEMKNIDQQEMADLHDFCKKHFGDGDAFAQTSQFRPSKEYIIALPNTEKDNLVTLAPYDEVGFLDIPPNEFGGEYQRLMAALDKDGIKYEKCYGIIVDYY